MKGSYVLLLRLSEAQIIAVGRLGDIRFPGGHYAYVGSAMGGLSARLNRHLEQAKRLHWHIDYLRQKASVTGTFLSESEQRQECAIAQAFNGELDCIPGFGSSDCRCRSHLFFSPDGTRMRKMTMEIFDRLTPVSSPSVRNHNCHNWQNRNWNRNCPR